MLTRHKLQMAIGTGVAVAVIGVGVYTTASAAPSGSDLVVGAPLTSAQIQVKHGLMQIDANISSGKYQNMA